MDATGHWEEVTAKYLSQIENMSNEEILEAWYLRAAILTSHMWRAGQRERAIELAEALQHYQHWNIWIERNSAFMIGLAIFYLAVDRAEDAAPLLEEAVAYLEREYAAGMRHPTIISDLAEVYAMQNRHDEALDMLANAIDYDSIDNWVITKYEEALGGAWGYDAWAPLRDDPRFVRQWNRMQALVDQRAANIRALLAQHDMDALLAPVAAMHAETGRGGAAIGPTSWPVSVPQSKCSVLLSTRKTFPKKSTEK